MFPLHDDNPTRRLPILTLGLIAANVAVFCWQLSLSNAPELDNAFPAQLCELGVVPDNLIGGSSSSDPCVALNAEHPAALSLVTSQFLHADWLHLLGNMLFLWIFGNNIEDRLGRVLFLPFYLLGGVAAGIAQSMSDSGSTGPLIGASGAIAAVLGAYLLLYPRARIWAFPIPFRIPAWVVLGAWVAMQAVLLGDQVPGAEDNTAYWAHIGGFVAGMVLIIPALIGRRPSPPRPPGALGW